MAHALGMHANTTGIAGPGTVLRSTRPMARPFTSLRPSTNDINTLARSHVRRPVQHSAAAAHILQSQPVLLSRSTRTACTAVNVSIDPSASEQQPPLQVTRSNFAAAVPAIKQALHECQFFSFDCEMTGLFLPAQDDHLVDDVDDRYVKTAAAAERFLIVQFGLSFFKWCGSCYEARSFNFYLFPRPNGEMDLRFMSQASALAFLAAEGFDFNKMIYEGIPFLPLSWRDTQLTSAAAAAAVPAVDDLDEDESWFMTNLQDQISTWLAMSSPAADPAAAGDEDVMYVPAPPPQFAKLQQRLLAAGIGSSRWPGSSSSSSSDQLLYIVDQPVPGQPAFGSSSSSSSVMLRKATPDRFEADRQFKAAHRAEELAAATGFSQIFELIRDSNKPAIAHNGRFDLAYTIAAFIQTPLPKTWAGFKDLVGQWFPGGVHDTKYLAHCLTYDPAAGGGRILMDTSLGACYTALSQGTPNHPQPLGSSSSSMSNLAAWIQEKTQSLDNPQAWQTLPIVNHAPGCEAYAAAAASSSSSSNAHEAGYDAFMTGVVFMGLMRLFEIEGVAQRSRWQQPLLPAGPPGLDSVQQYAWRQYFARSKHIEYAALQGPEMVPNRPEVLFLTKFSNGTRWQDIQKKLSQLGLGRPNVSMVRANGLNTQPTGAYVTFQTAKAAQKALQAIRATKNWKVTVMTYSDYFFSKHGGSSSTAAPVVRAAPAAVAAAAEEPAVAGDLVQQLQQKTAVARQRQQQQLEEQQQQQQPTELLDAIMSSIEEELDDPDSSSRSNGESPAAAAADSGGSNSSSSDKAVAAAAMLAERQRRLDQLQQQQQRLSTAAPAAAAGGLQLKRPSPPKA